MTALLWFHDEDKRFDARDREPQLEGTQCRGGGVQPIPGERDGYQCVVHGQRMYYVQRDPAERTIDSPLRDHADALGNVGNSGPSYAGTMKSASNSTVVHDFGYMSLPVEVQVDLEKRAEQYGPMWRKVLQLAYDEQAKFLKDDPLANAMGAWDAVVDGEATLRQIGWYCAGGHETQNYDSENAKWNDNVAEPSLRFEDPCAHGVPVYVLVHDKTSRAKVEPVDYSNDHPDPTFVRNTVGELVRVTTHDGQELLGHLVTYGGVPPLLLEPLYIEMDRVSGTPVDSPTIRIEWSNLRTCEPA